MGSSAQNSPGVGEGSAGSGEGSGRLWCRARSGSTGFRRRFRGGFGAEPGQVQQVSGESSGRLWCRVPEKVPEKVWEALVQSQVRFNRICAHLIDVNPAEVFPALGFAARFRKICKHKTLRLLGIPPKLIIFPFSWECHHPN